MNDLEAAVQVAVEAHASQTDKAGETYIRHPLRVMERMDPETERVVAVLHDVVEDAEYELADIERRFGVDVREAIDALTKREGETYDEFIRRAGSDPVARKVKIADLEDNMDLKRLSSPDAIAEDRLKKYHRSWQYLTSLE